MVEMRALFRAVTGLLLGVMGSLIVFGLSLALSWVLASASPSLELIGLYLSSGLGMIAAGYIFSWQGRVEGLILPAIAGFFLGGLSAGYILGPTLPALGFASCAAVLASLGSVLHHRLAGGRRPPG